MSYVLGDAAAPAPMGWKGPAAPTNDPGSGQMFIPVGDGSRTTPYEWKQITVMQAAGAPPAAGDTPPAGGGVMPTGPVTTPPTEEELASACAQRKTFLAGAVAAWVLIKAFGKRG